MGTFAAAGCGNFSTANATNGAAATDAASGSGKGPRVLQIVATTGMVADLVGQIAGEHAAVTALMGPGVDPHLYKPTRNDVRRLLDADVLVYSGLMLEHRMEDSIKQVGRNGKPVFAVTDGLDQSRLRRPEDSAGSYDPHVWMDVALWSQCAEHVAARLAEIDPAHAQTFHDRAAAYRSQLQDLDAYVAQVIASIPESQRILVTAHDAFGYFSDRYGIEVRSVQGVSTESEAGVQDVNLLVDFLVERRLPAIFVETSVNPKHLQAVLEGCAARGVEVSVGGELYSDAMGPIDTYEGTYLGMIDANATTIARSLGGTAPAKGWQGRLAE